MQLISLISVVQPFFPVPIDNFTLTIIEGDDICTYFTFKVTGSPLYQNSR